MMSSCSGAQRSAEWHLWRRGGIGSSDAPVIMGLSPYRNIHDLWLEKTGQVPASTFTNRHMERGIALEPQARGVAEELLMKKLHPVELEHPEYQYLRASLDGADAEGTILIEIKCPTQATHEKYLKSGEIPKHYVCQIQHQLLVSGIPTGWFFSYSEQENNGWLVEVPRNEEFISELLRREQEFWRCVEEKIPPRDEPVTDLLNSYATNKTNEWRALSSEYIRLSNAIKELESKRDIMKGALIAIAGGIKTAGAGLTISFQQRSALDRKLLVAELGELTRFETKSEPYPVIKIDRVC